MDILPDTVTTEEIQIGYAYEKNPTYGCMDTRKFVYTMVTRAKTKVLLVDPFDKMKTYIAQANTVDRRTRLDYYIKNNIYA